MGQRPVPHPAFRQRKRLCWQVGFRMFLNTTAAVTNWNAEGTECSLVRPAYSTLDTPDKPTCRGPASHKTWHARRFWRTTR